MNDDRQAAIIQAVWKVIGEQGMAGVSMRTVAAAAMVSVGRVQYRFRTKDELLRASLEAMLSGAAQQHADAVEGADAADILWHLLAHPILRVKESKAGVAVFHHYVAAGINHPALARLIADAKDDQEREVSRLLRRIAPDLHAPRSAARSLVALVDGLVLRMLTGGLSQRQAERVLRTALDTCASSS